MQRVPMTLYARGVLVGLAADIPLEALRWIFKTSLGVSEDNAGVVFDGLVGLVVLPVLYGALILMAKDRMDQATNTRPRTFLRAVGDAMPLWGRFVVTQITIGFVVMGHVAIAFVPGLAINYAFKFESPYALIPYGVVGALWALSTVFFAPTLVVTEGASPWQARIRSRELSLCRRWTTAWYALVLVLIPELLGMMMEPSLGKDNVQAVGKQLFWVDFFGGMEGLGVIFRLGLGMWGVVGVIKTYELYLQRRSEINVAAEGKKLTVAP